MGIRERIEQARLKKALSDARKEKEKKQQMQFETEKEKRRIIELEEKHKLHQLKERRRSLERKTGSGLRGFAARTERARAGIARRRVSFSRRASKTRLAAFETAGLAAPRRARIVSKKRKRKRKNVVGYRIELR